MEPSTFQIISSIFILLLIIAVVYMFLQMKKNKNTETGLFIPAGTIVMWDASAPPEGWAICDGSRGTPDLTGRFVAGAGMSSETGDVMYTLHEKGGENKHSLTADENGPHTHTARAGGWSEPSYDGGKNWLYNNHGETGSSGKGIPHENRPPFVALTYIMKM